MRPSARTVINANMCKRLISACIMCRVTTATFVVCKKYDPKKNPNIFASGWMYEHAKANKYNVKNSVKFTFCDSCRSRNETTTQPECDRLYSSTILSMLSDMRSSYVGSTEVRNVIGSGIVFL
jgi:hypothetical protein